MKSEGATAAATVIAFVWMKRRQAGDSGFQITSKNPTFARLPSVGELVNLGDDSGGVSADYKVVMVVHAPLRSNGIDAEIYLERIDLPDEILRISSEIETRAHDRADVLPDLTANRGK